MYSRVDVHVENLRKLGYKNLLHWLNSNEDHVYVGRTVKYVDGAKKHILSNPFTVKKYGREECLIHYKNWLDKQDIEEIEKLRGKTLGCWCAINEGCHVDIIIEKLINLSQNNNNTIKEKN